MVTKSTGENGEKDGAKFVRAAAVPMLGAGVEVADKPVALDQHIAVAADDIAKAIAEAGKSGGLQTRDFGIATTLHGLWIKDGTESRYETSIMSANQLYTVVADYHSQGFRPIDVMGSGRLFEPWSVAFGPRRDVGYYWQTTANDQEFIAKDMDLFRAGFRMTSFNRRHNNFNTTWVWTGSSAAQFGRWDMDWFGLLSWDRYYQSQGLRIVAIDRYGDQGMSYAAVWQPGEGEQIIEAPGGFNTYLGQPAKLLVYKYDRQGLEIRAMGHNGFAVAAYRPKQGNYHQEWTYNTASSFRSYDQSCSNDGYRLSFLSHAPWQIG